MYWRLKLFGSDSRQHPPISKDLQDVLMCEVDKHLWRISLHIDREGGRYRYRDLTVCLRFEVHLPGVVDDDVSVG